MGIECYDPIVAADAEGAGTAHLLWFSHHLLFCLHLCDGKIDSGDRSGLSDLFDPVAASLKKVAAPYRRVCTHAIEFK